MATKRKQTDSPNAELIDFLNGTYHFYDFVFELEQYFFFINLELADYEKNVSRMIHKSNAYKKAAGSIGRVTHKIESIKDIKGLVSNFFQDIFSCNCRFNNSTGRHRKKDRRKDSTVSFDRKN